MKRFVSVGIFKSNFVSISVFYIVCLSLKNYINLKKSKNTKKYFYLNKNPLPIGVPMYAQQQQYMNPIRVVEIKGNEQSEKEMSKNENKKKYYDITKKLQGKNKKNDHEDKEESSDIENTTMIYI